VRRLAALSATLVIAFELTVNYWFYPYITWFEPFVFLALLVETNTKTALDSDASETARRARDHPVSENEDTRRESRDRSQPTEP
jgi:hypothetical protein